MTVEGKNIEIIPPKTKSLYLELWPLTLVSSRGYLNQLFSRQACHMSVCHSPRRHPTVADKDAPVI